MYETITRTGKEIFKSAIRLEPTERVPVIILSGGVWAFNQKGLSLQDSFDMPPEESADYIIEMNKKVRSDLIWCAAGCNHLVLRALGAKSKFKKVGKAADVKPMITSPKEVDKLNPDRIKEDPGIIAMVECTKILKKKIGDQTMLGVSQWGPMTLASLMMGTTEFMIGLMKDKEGMEYLMEFTRELVVTYWKLFADAGVEHVSQAEPVASGDMISRAMFEEFALPHLQYTNNKIKDSVFSKMIHICGNTENLFPVLPETGTDMFSMDWKTSLKKAREELGGKIAFAGQVDPSNVMLLSDESTVKEKAEECIRDARWEQGGYVLMPGCDLAPETPLSHLNAMMDVAYGHTQEITTK
ncbi:MAG: uroporphyrinogen decarboxylase family protein [Lachnospiraceae bacterium]|nr:uroporphyrinogen decarboxylase family protein [Lachnospiraceae bacterium]